MSAPLSGQLVAEASPRASVEPPIRGSESPVVGDALPLQLTSFIGRAREVSAVVGLLDSTRLLTLTGAGGSGKTRLALEAAGRFRAASGESLAWVELAPLSEPGLVADAVGEALGLRDTAGPSALQTLTGALRARSLLLLLDNCEHLVDACAELVDALLRSCPSLRVLATSREALGVAGETAWLVPPLSLPAEGAPAALSAEDRSEAVRLFVERARAIVPDFDLNAGNADAVAQICRRLDGIPLAIEFAAARLRTLAPEQIAERLDDRFRLLTTRTRASLSRHQTLRATIDWSYGLLSPPEALLMDRLSTFAGTFTLESAEVVCADEDLAEEEVLDVLSELVEKSLVEVLERDGEARYRLLESIRGYGAERLAQRGERPRLERRHADRYHALVAEAEPHLTTAGRTPWILRIQREFDEVRQALAWARREDPQLHVDLVGRLCWFWFSSPYWGEGRRWLEGALELEAARAPTPIRARALFAAGILPTLQAQPAVAIPLLEECVALSGTLGDARLEAYALNYLGMALVQDGEPRGRPLLERARAWFEANGDDYGLRLAYLLLGTLALQTGDPAGAAELYGEGLRIARRFGQPREIGIAAQCLAGALIVQGDADGAAALLRESVVAFRGEQAHMFLARSLEGLGVIASKQGAPLDAVRLIGAADALREVVGAAMFTVDRQIVLPRLEALRVELGEAFAGAWAEGRAMAVGEAAAFALRGGGSREGGRPGTEEGGADVATLTNGARPEAPSGVHTAQAGLRVRALGSLEVEVDGAPIAASAWAYAKPRELLLFLLTHPDGRTRDQIGAALWPESTAGQVKNSFHVTLHHLRKVLGRPEWIRFEGGRYRIAPDGGFGLDAAAFEEAAAAALRGARAGEAAVEPLREALALYRGDFLEGEPAGDWHTDTRDRLRALCVDALVALGELLLDGEVHPEAIAVFQAAIVRDDLREEAHRCIMVARARMGERAHALRHYDRLAALLRDELDGEPDPESVALYERIRAGQPV